MGLFSRSSTDASRVDNRTDTVPTSSRGYNGTTAATEPRRSSRLFGSSHNSNTSVDTTEPSRRSGSGFFGSSRSNASVNTTEPVHRGSSGIFHRNQEDASIVAARERVMRAEVAEKEADKALLEAKAMSRSAREQTKLLEREAAEQALAAKQKQHAAKRISKRGNLLGRHDHITV